MSFRALLSAVGLLTRVPVRLGTDDGRSPAGRAVAFFPVAGAVIGVVLLGLALLGRQMTAVGAHPLLPGALLVAAWAALTGGLHLDGWADCCDALFVPATREKRLAILKDPHLGSFGTIGLVLLLLVKASAAGELVCTSLAGNGSRLLLLLAVAPVVARWVMALALATYPLAKTSGMAAFFRQGLTWREPVLATLFTAVLVLPLGWDGLFLVSAAWSATALVAHLALERLGGLTGDVYGAIVELAETTVLTLACWR